MSRSEFFERALYNYLFAILRPVVYATLGVKELADYGLRFHPARRQA